MGSPAGLSVRPGISHSSEMAYQAEQLVWAGISALTLLVAHLNPDHSVLSLLAPLPFLWRGGKASLRSSIIFGLMVASLYGVIICPADLAVSAGHFFVKFICLNLALVTFALSINLTRRYLGFNPLVIAILWLPLQYLLTHDTGISDIFTINYHGSGLALRIATLFGTMVLSFLTILIDALIVFAADRAILNFHSCRIGAPSLCGSWTVLSKSEVCEGRGHIAPEVRGPPGQWALNGVAFMTRQEDFVNPAFFMRWISMLRMIGTKTLLMALALFMLIATLANADSQIWIDRQTYYTFANPGNTPVPNGPWIRYTGGSISVPGNGSVWIGVENLYDSLQAKYLNLILRAPSRLDKLSYVKATGFDNFGDSTKIAVQVQGLSISSTEIRFSCTFDPQPKWEFVKFNNTDPAVVNITSIYAESQCTNVPTLTQWGIGILAAMIIVSTIFVYRRKKLAGA